MFYLKFFPLHIGKIDLLQNFTNDHTNDIIFNLQEYMDNCSE